MVIISNYHWLITIIENHFSTYFQLPYLITIIIPHKNPNDPKISMEFCQQFFDLCRVARHWPRAMQIHSMYRIVDRRSCLKLLGGWKHLETNSWRGSRVALDGDELKPPKKKCGLGK